LTIDAGLPSIEPPTPERAARRLSAVWLVPAAALAVSLAVAWTTYAARGPVVEIALPDAAGIVADQTTLRFRNVTVGMVEDVRFTEDLARVIAEVRVDKEMARHLDAEAEFWVVRPSVTAQGVTGIETVLSGVYIEAYWDDEDGPRVTSFDALPRPPLTPADQPGVRIALRAPDGGSINVGAPVLYKSIRVGRVETVELDEAGDVVIAAFVNAPYDDLVTAGSRFWNASGFSIQLGAAGASLNVESLVSLLQGGVAFEQVGSSIDPVTPDQVFELYASEDDARRNVIDDLPGGRLNLTAFFDASVNGLEPGARVAFRGVTVGEVTAFQPVIEERPEGPRIRMRVNLSVAPERLGVPADAEDPEAAALDLLDQLVARGLRAQLTATGLLSQALFVNLSELPDAAPASLIREAEPYPVIPNAPPEISGVAASAEGVLNRISALPIEELIETVTTLLANVNAIVADESVRAAPENLGLLLADIRDIVATSGIRETPPRSPTSSPPSRASWTRPRPAS
jgi:paraquat-inducible protein B